MITRSGISSGVYVGLVCYVCVLCYSLVSQYTNRMCSCTWIKPNLRWNWLLLQFILVHSLLALRLSTSDPKFYIDPSSPWSARNWKRSFESYTHRLNSVTEDKLDILIGLLHNLVYSYISDCTAYDNATTCLHNAYLKPASDAFVRYRLNTFQQKKFRETRKEFLQRIRTAILQPFLPVANMEATIRDASGGGLSSTYIYDKSFWQTTSCKFKFKQLFKAQSLDEVQRNAEAYTPRSMREKDIVAVCHSSEENNATERLFLLQWEATSTWKLSSEEQYMSQMWIKVLFARCQPTRIKFVSSRNSHVCRW